MKKTIIATIVATVIITTLVTSISILSSYFVYQVSRLDGQVNKLNGIVSAHDVVLGQIVQLINSVPKK